MNIAICTLGCKVNQYETQAMERELVRRGHALVPFEGPADAYIVNTCTVTAVSDKKSRQMIRRARKQSPDAVVAVCGCYPQTHPQDAEALDVDLVAGTGDRMRFLDLLEDAAREKEPVVSLDEALRRRTFEVLPAGGLAERTRAMLKVEDGCANFCSYCIIPYARGPVRSLPLNAAAAQAELAQLQAGLDALNRALEGAREALAARGLDLAGTDAAIGELSALLENGVDVDPEAQRARCLELEARRGQVAEAQKTVRSRRDANETALRNITKKAADLADLEREYAWVRALSNTVNGNLPGKEKVALETYIQAAFLDRILLRANLLLLAMSGGQYELKRRKAAADNRSQSGLELDVTDHYNGTERSVKSLSGGESFQASLSLALGLAGEIQSAAGGIRLDAMFVDEGFGSLDGEALQQAIRALTGLADENRLVGIISHVAELKEKIDKQIAVTKDRSGGSRTEIIV